MIFKDFETNKIELEGLLINKTHQVFSLKYQIDYKILLKTKYPNRCFKIEDLWMNLVTLYQTKSIKLNRNLKKKYIDI